MVIQHNLPALNAYRNYTSNTNAVSKNLEKLSSGYKINSAGDDAAGLAISEKMRAQITGLETAQDNASNGISLVQTAEGALTEVHDMLNRMVELADQSANGTYDDETDRANLQKEITQLKSEIDRIADSTNFNGIKLLDGSINSTSAVTSATTAAVTGQSFTIADSVDGTNREHVEASSYQAEVAAYGITNTDATNTQDIAFTYNDTTGASKTITLTLTAGSSATVQDIVDALNTGTGGDLSAADSGDDIATDPDNGGIFAELYTASVGDNNRIVITAKAATAATSDVQAAITGNEDKLGGFALSGTIPAEITVDQGTNVDAFASVITEIAGVAESDSPATLGTTTVTLLAGANITSGSSLKIGDTTYEFLKDGATAATGNIGINITDSSTAAQIAQLINDNAASTGGQTGYDISYSGGTLTVTNRVTDGQSSTDNDLTKSIEKGGTYDVHAAVSFTAATVSAAKTTLTFDASKLSNNTTVKVGSASYLLTTDSSTTAPTGTTVVTYAKGASSSEIAAAFATAAGGTVDGAKVNITGIQTVSATSAGLSLQIGDTSDSFNKLTVTIDDMHASSLDIDDIDISTQLGAEDAVSKIKVAINSVSSVRGNLGATQNRLEHTINNLSTMTENITDAESSIRDVDVAEEMMSYTKNNILVQSAQAMLAQANQLPQGVLQLLQ